VLEYELKGNWTGNAEKGMREVVKGCDGTWNFLGLVHHLGGHRVPPGDNKTIRGIRGRAGFGLGAVMTEHEMMWNN